MDGIDPKDVLSFLLGPLGTLVLALISIWALVTEKVVPKRRLDEVTALLQKSHEQGKEAVSLTAEAMREQMWKADIDRQIAALRENVGAPPPRDA